MKSSRTAWACLLVALLLALGATARADVVVGKMTQDLTVGANKDVTLKTGEGVQILKESGTATVIMVPMPDGSNGIFQIASTAIQVAPAGTPLGMPPPPPKPPPAPGTVPPSYPDDFAGMSTFETTQGEHTTGAAGLIKAGTGDQLYLLSTRELLGPRGGFDTQVAANDVPHFVQSIKIANFSGGTKTYNVTALPVPASGLKAEGGRPIDDLAIYAVSSPTSSPSALAFAAQAPAVGDIVWVLGRMRHVPDGEFAHRGQVTAVNQWLEMQFDNSDTVTSGASGAPVLNNAGEVVGIFSTSLTEAGNVRGYIIPASLIAKTIPATRP